MRRTTSPLTGIALAAALVAGAGPTSAAGALPGAVAVPNSIGTAAAVPSVQQLLVPTVAANARIKSVLPKRTRKKILGKRFTMSVFDAQDGEFVYKRRSKAALRGASTTKILTTIGALALLGPEHRFPTTVRQGSTPDEIILVAGGDPLLTSANLRALARRTAAALTSASAAEGQASPAPAASGSPEPSASSLPATSGPDPSNAPAEPTARTITVRADDSLFSGSGQSRGWPNFYLPNEVRPVGAFARDDRKVRDATKDTGAYFAAALRAAGVPATYSGEGVAGTDSATLASYRGHRLAKAVSRTLLVSDNDTAEMLFRHIAVARGLPGTWEGARQALTDTLTELGVPMTRVQIIDGSGLSLDGRLTARALTAALTLALSADHPELAGLRGWLPVAGRTGTLQAAYLRFTAKRARCAAGLVQAKTGTLADSIALAGYAAGADGHTKVFVSIVNSRPTRYSRLTTRKAVDRVVSGITGCW